MKPIVMKVLASAALLTLAACAVQPETHADLQHTVQTVAPTAWNVDAPQDSINANTWWTQFGDPVMHQLVESVLTGNLDVQAAVERVKQAQDLAKQNRAALLPELNASATASDSRQNTPPPLGYVRQAGVGVTASWTPDVFGGERLAVLAAEGASVGSAGGLESTAPGTRGEHSRGVYRSALGAIAIADSQRQRTDPRPRPETHAGALALRTVDATRRRACTESVGRFAGADPAHPVGRAASTEPDRGVFGAHAGERRRLAAAANARDIPVPAQSVPQMLPSEALLQRPDVRNAYATVEQRAAEVGVSKAQRYPQFRLNLADGLLASSYLGLPTLTDNLFSAALNATSPIFNAGRITANIDASESRMRESQLGLQQTMLQALKEIEDNRSDLVSGAVQVQRLGGALDASNHALRLSSELYKGGATDFLDVLAAQEAYLRDAESLNQAKREHALAAVALYRSLGGGWDVPETVTAASAN